MKISVLAAEVADKFADKVADRVDARLAERGGMIVLREEKAIAGKKRKS
jgi:hypothetical protein